MTARGAWCSGRYALQVAPVETTQQTGFGTGSGSTAYFTVR